MIKKWINEENLGITEGSLHLFSFILFIVVHHLLLLLPIELSVPVSYFLSALTCVTKQKDTQPTTKLPRQPSTSVSTHIITARSGQPASPSLVSSIVVVHFLSHCKCEGCSSLRRSYSSSTYPAVEPVSPYEPG